MQLLQLRHETIRWVREGTTSNTEGSHFISNKNKNGSRDSSERSVRDSATWTRMVAVKVLMTRIFLIGFGCEEEKDLRTTSSVTPLCVWKKIATLLSRKDCERRIYGEFESGVCVSDTSSLRCCVEI